MTKPLSDNEILGGLRTPDPPMELRARTLVAAARVTAVTPPVTVWRTVLAYFSAQPVWTAALVGVLVAHLTLGFFLRSAPSGRLVLPRDEEVAAQPELLRLPRMREVEPESVAFPLHVAIEAGDLS